jgi:hypothetical protein
MEERLAKMRCSFPGELEAGWLYSVPREVSTPIPVYEYTEEELADLIERNRKISEENVKKYEGEW